MLCPYGPQRSYSHNQNTSSRTPANEPRHARTLYKTSGSTARRPEDGIDGAADSIEESLRSQRAIEKLREAVARKACGKSAALA